MASTDDGWDEYLKTRVQLWYEHNEICSRRCFTVTEFLGMTLAEYADWVVQDKVTDRVKRVWKSTFEAWQERGYEL